MHEHNHENDPHSFLTDLSISKKAVTQPLQELLPALYKHLGTLPARYAATADNSSRVELFKQTVALTFPLLAHVKQHEVQQELQAATKEPSLLSKARPATYGAGALALSFLSAPQILSGDTIGYITGTVNLISAAIFMWASGLSKAELALKKAAAKAAAEVLEENPNPLADLNLPKHNYDLGKITELVDMNHHLLTHIVNPETDGDNLEDLTEHAQQAMNLLEEIMPNIASQALKN